MGTRETFVARFGEDDAKAIESAAETHVGDSETHATDNRGSDEFRYLFLAAIGYECVGRYRGSHGITATEDDLRDWALRDGRLGEHEGDLPDYLALFTGAYEGWVVMPEEPAVPTEKE